MKRRVCKPTDLALFLVFSLITLLIFALDPATKILIDPYIFHTDEGINLMKAMLLSNGAELYAQIWSDQPPLLAQIFSVFYSLFGNRVEVYRVFVLLLFVLASALMLSAHAKRAGFFPSVLALVAFLLCDEVKAFSVLANIGMPSLSFAMIALYFVNESAEKQRGTLRIFAGGLFMGFAIATKLWTVLILLACIVQVALDAETGRRGRSALIFAASTCLTFLIIMLLSTASLELALTQLLKPHLLMQLRGNHAALWQLLSHNGVGVLLAATLVVAITNILRHQRYVLPALWFIFSLAGLIAHRPSWEHHLPMLQIPAAMVIASELCVWLRAFGNRKLSVIRDSLSLAAIIAYVVCLGLQCNARTFYAKNMARYEFVNEEILTRLRDAESKIHSMFTDRAYLAFLLGKPIAPELAVISEKRLVSGQITIPEIVRTIQDTKPELLWFERFGSRFSAAIVDELDDRHYVRVYARAPHVVYAARELWLQNLENYFENERDLARAELGCNDSNCQLSIVADNPREGLHALKVELAAKANIVDFPISRFEVPPNNAPALWTRFSVRLEARESSSRFDLVSEARNGVALVTVNNKGIKLQGDFATPELRSRLEGVTLTGSWLDFVMFKNFSEKKYRLWINSLLVASGSLDEVKELSLRLIPESSGSAWYIDNVMSGSYPSAVLQSSTLLDRGNDLSPSELDMVLDKLFPRAPKEVVRVSKTIKLLGTEFDGQGRLYLWEGKGECSQREGQPPIFDLRGNAKVKNLTILNAPDGIHLRGNHNTVENVTFLQVCEDAITFNEGNGSVVRNSRFYNCQDKAVQVNTKQSLELSDNFFAACGCALRLVGFGASAGSLVTLENNTFWKVGDAVRPNDSELLSGNVLLNAAPAKFEALYLRGIAPWIESQGGVELREGSKGVFSTEIELEADGRPYKFKFADKEWSRGTNCGYQESADRVVTLGKSVHADCDAQYRDFEFTPQENGLYLFTLDTRSKPYLVSIFRKH